MSTSGRLDLDPTCFLIFGVWSSRFRFSAELFPPLFWLLICIMKIKSYCLSIADLSSITSPSSNTGGSRLIFFDPFSYFVFYLPPCTLPDFLSVSSLASLPFLPCCHRTTTKTSISIFSRWRCSSWCCAHRECFSKSYQINPKSDCI